MIFLLKNAGVPYYSILDPERKNVFAVKKIINICETENIDIIHTHLGTGNYLGVLAGNFLKIPVFSTINIFSGYPYYALADRLSFVSLSVKNYFIEYFSSEEYKRYTPGYIEKIINKIFKLKYNALNIKEIINKMDITYERIDENEFTNYSINNTNTNTNCNLINNKNNTGSDESLDKFKNFFNIGITGRVTEQKGQVYLVKAAELLLKSGLKSLTNKSLMFHIIGNGNDEKKLKNIVNKMGIADNFKFWGYQKDVRKFVDMFDIAVSCSLNEPFGVNNIEYMFMKKPCIATNTGGIPEVYDNTNIIIPPKDPAKLKEAIETYIKNPDVMKKEALKGFERANRLFKSDISVNRIISIYEDMLIHR
ncbi:MAG: glycosyltransferase [Candidatus Acididesulfobacter guangdongensis]|uniref:Glycosyltransferase n=1 Tax=Acididesulfobacter guangdongensis TaxID=2597225 RepID=A0A519BJ67_ACIG2|nr:MAG: glycosyltransferase [Candidatus Acididesulfobacter guangdongensis]